MAGSSSTGAANVELEHEGMLAIHEVAGGNQWVQHEGTLEKAWLPAVNATR